LAGREGRDAGLDFVNRVTTPGGADFVAPAARIAAFDNDGTLRMEQPLPPQFDFVFGTWALEVQHDPSLAEQQPTKHAFGLSLVRVEPGLVCGRGPVSGFPGVRPVEEADEQHFMAARKGWRRRSRPHLVRLRASQQHRVDADSSPFRGAAPSCPWNDPP